MQTKDELVNAIKQWVSLETDLKEKQREVTVLRKQKKEIGQYLLDTMKGHQIDAFELPDGELRYKTKKTKRPLTQKVIESLLDEYYANNVQESELVKTYLSDHRSNVVTDTLIHKKNEIVSPPKIQA
jgi:predicted kinase